MASMNIRIQPTDSKWRPGIRMAKGKQEQERLLGQFAHYIANIYRDELIKAINSQRYRGRWVPLSPEYAEWKRRTGLSPNIWESTSLLKDSISVYRSNNEWVVGVNPYLRYPNSKTYVHKVIRYMEFGTSKMPARPLFRPVKKLIEGRMRKYWNEFLESHGIIP